MLVGFAITRTLFNGAYTIMNLFTQFETNTDSEKNGIILHFGYADEAQKKPIQIRIRRAGGSNEQYSKRLEILTKPHRRAIQAETIDKNVIKDIFKRVYAETVIVGWENINDKAGKPIEFTVDNAIDLFTKLPDLFDDIQEQASKQSLFRAEELEEDAKN